jgi:hypothetical protein
LHFLPLLSSPFQNHRFWTIKESRKETAINDFLGQPTLFEFETQKKSFMIFSLLYERQFFLKNLRAFFFSFPHEKKTHETF